MINRILHRPPHLCINQTWYFITAHTVDNFNVFTTTEHKDIWLDNFSKLIHEYKLTISAWVLLPNHYHFLAYFDQTTLISHFIKRLHGSTSFQLNKIDDKQGRSIWYSYWDRCIRNENDYWIKFNYTHYNPIKHGYVKQLDDWELSSYPDLLKLYGEVWFSNCWETYPIVEFDFE